MAAWARNGVVKRVRPKEVGTCPTQGLEDNLRRRGGVGERVQIFEINGEDL